MIHIKLYQRILKAEKLLPTKSPQSRNSGLDETFKGLIKYNEEFRECIKQLWRLQQKNKEESHLPWKRWRDPYREQAEIILKRINEIIEEQKDTDN